ncbi:MAG: hypothetical protein QOJ63_1689 [Solirubrobacteraceae bacterium]|jgi:hypothetical protein|nr:hypothetical protein [Solirubrobacteraceae bacterium]
MDRALWIGSLVACLLAGADVAMAQTAVIPQAPPLSATLETCQTSPLPVERVASFVGSMPAMADDERMQMRFDLERRRPGERLWRRARGVEGFGVWESAMPGRAGFVFHKRVDGLQVPASYRALVRLRWYRADGRLARRSSRRTPACNQPDLRPDLVPGQLRAVLDARPALAVYTLVVRNDGGAPAGPFTVRVAGGISEVAGLMAGQQLEVLVVAGACSPGSLVRAIVDADRRVDEADEHDGLLSSCPLTA